MLYLEKRYLSEIVSHAQAEAPNECCGILTGKNSRVTRLYRTINAEHSPVRYSVDLNDLVKVYQDIGENGWELLAIYHSHVHKEAYPSPVDIKYAYFPQAYYIIISLKDPLQPVARAFIIRKGEVTEQELEVVVS
jgi:[CysO sulfur-carrier protein]-S-L-cysteine hydrolase